MITAESLTKTYGGTPSSATCRSTCAPGTITGFLGPNGAGKSTTLRMITGLTRPDRGRSSVAGRPFAELPNPTRVVGTLLDPTAMHPGRSGRATLHIAARMAGLPTSRVAEVARPRRPLRRRPRTPGRQLLARHAAAAGHRPGACSAEPQALILDEPANGLDPEGIAWMRGLLRDFADRGGTVLLSSHLLHEVQATVDHLVVIAGGAVARPGRLEDLLGTGEPGRPLAGARGPAAAAHRAPTLRSARVRTGRSPSIRPSPASTPSGSVDSPWSTACRSASFAAQTPPASRTSSSHSPPTRTVREIA